MFQRLLTLADGWSVVPTPPVSVSLWCPMWDAREGWLVRGGVGKLDRNRYVFQQFSAGKS